jgi:hypothetical protein
MTLSIERADRRMGLASDRTVYSSKRNRPLLLYGRLLDDSRPSHGLTATNPDYFLFADHTGVAEQVGRVSHPDDSKLLQRCLVRVKTKI